MENFSYIGKSHLERAEKIKNKANILGFILLTLIIISWLSNEYTYKKVKYDSLVIYQKYQKIKKLKTQNFSGKNNEKAESEISILKRELDSTSYKKINPEIFQAIEKSLPNPFPYFLSQNIKLPFGLFLSSLTILFLVLYFSYTRKIILKHAAIGLRIIQQEELGRLNPYHDYGLILPFWVFPIKKLKAHNLKIADLIKIGSSPNNLKQKFILLSFFHLILILIQARLLFFSLIINEYSREWILWTQTLGLGIHLLILALWFRSFQIQNLFKTEKYQPSINRRNVVFYFVGFLVYGFIGRKLIIERPNFISSYLNPRTKNKKANSQHKLCFLIESKAKQFIKEQNPQCAYNFMKGEIIKFTVLKNNKDLAISFSRLFDLQLKIIFQFSDKRKKFEMFSETINIGKKSNEERIFIKMVNWEEKHLNRFDSNK